MVSLPEPFVKRMLAEKALGCITEQNTGALGYCG